MQVRFAGVHDMDMSCPRCGGPAEPAGHEDARAFFRCDVCDRVWATHLAVLGEVTRRSAAAATRVLVADDAPEMLGLLTAWLEEEGCIVIAVGSGREALAAAAAYKPDVAFLDVILPAPDGLYVAATITRSSDAAVVLMTGVGNPDALRVDETGALLLLQKPFEREALVDALGRALEHRRRGRPQVPALYGRS